MPKIRVLRLLEYEYETWEQAELDWRKWMVPPTGVKAFGTKVVRSSIIVAPRDDDEEIET